MTSNLFEPLAAEVGKSVFPWFVGATNHAREEVVPTSGVGFGYLPFSRLSPGHGIVGRDLVPTELAFINAAMFARVADYQLVARSEESSLGDEKKAKPRSVGPENHGKSYL